MSARRLLLLPLAALLVAGKAAPPVGPPPPAALGWDWIDDRTPTPSDPAPWPNAAAGAAGLDDMIHTSRDSVAGADAQRMRHGVVGRLDRMDAHVVVPVLRLRFR